MPAVGMAAIVGPASAAGRGVGAFNLIGIEHAEAIISGAEAAGAPVVLAISENCVAYHGALEPVGAAALAIARSAAVPVTVHLDHATSADLVREAAALGFGSVMYRRLGAAVRGECPGHRADRQLVPGARDLGRGRDRRDRRQEWRA